MLREEVRQLITVGSHGVSEWGNRETEKKKQDFQ